MQQSSTIVPVRRGLSEDWVSLIIGLLIVLLAFVGATGTDLLGWVTATSVWTDVTHAVKPTAKSYAALGPIGSLAATYAATVILLSGAALALRTSVAAFVLRFSIVFVIAYGAWILGSYAHFAAVTPADFKTFGIAWSLRLTNEGGFIVALIAGLIVANVFPRFADWLSAAIRPELYIKVAIVILGSFLALTIASKLSFASTIVLRGIAAIIEAYLIYWAVVYYVARRWFGFNREWAVPLASGISICGVAAAVATGGAIRARPMIPVLVSSLVVIFAVVEVLVLPVLAQTFLSHEPMVAAAWMGLAVKTDGAAVSAGGITEALILAKNAAEGTQYQTGWLLGTTAAIKIFIDAFIGVWSFILAFIWTRYINVVPGDQARLSEIWQRFPKFILGFLVTFGSCLALALTASPATLAKLTPSIAEANTFRVIFFILTFFSIGVLSNVRKLWEAGIGKLAAIYVISLFGFVIWVGLLISWIFFAGIKPPLAG